MRDVDAIRPEHVSEPGDHTDMISRIGRQGDGDSGGFELGTQVVSRSTIQTG